ncbi:MAG: DUF3347 domain-containing protein [Leptospiraceae bacterium]|nr:DUF3347 domain-containing protein [Leptospiraceae bacterium]
MKLGKNILFALILTLFAVSCEAKEILDPGSAKAIKNILEANQAVNNSLLADDKNLPNLANLAKVIASSKAEAKNIEVKTSLDTLEKSIKNIGATPKKDDFFKEFSAFSEELAVIAKKFKVDSAYNRFFCPMVSKTWVAKGTQIKNPYAADMRDCGEIVK